MTPRETSRSTSPAPAVKAATLLHGPFREGVAAVPRQAGHADAERVKHVRGPRLDAEALDSLEREHEADALAGFGRVQVGCARHLRDATRVLGERAVERGDLRERLAERPLRLHDDVDVDRADLEPDAALLEERKPGRREDVALAEPPLAVGELEQKVDMGIRDHGRYDRRLATPGLTHVPRRG